MTIPSDYLRRAVYAKYFLRRASELMRHRTLLSTSEALLALHDAAEMLMRVVGDQLRVKAFYNFMEFWPRVKDVTAAEPPHRASMDRMNDARNSFKHKGIPPHHTVVSGFQTLVSEFCRDLSRDFLGLDFEQLSLADLITREPVRDLVRESEAFLEKGAVSTALERLALAHETLQKLAEQDSQETLTGFGGRIKFQYSSRDPLVNEMQSWLEDLILDHEKVSETLNMLLLGIDPHAYLFFRKSVPVILRTGLMEEVTFVRLPSQTVSDPETYLRCRDFIIEFSLRNDELFKP